jgi:hypothetical protein
MAAHFYNFSGAACAESNDPNCNFLYLTEGFLLSTEPSDKQCGHTALITSIKVNLESYSFSEGLILRV